MKAILFTDNEKVEFESLQLRIQNHLTSLSGTDGFHYSAERWAGWDNDFVYENKKFIPIRELPIQRYNYIYEILTEEERNSIVDITKEGM